MSCVIVGHGPSLFEAKLGTFIDTFDNIIRLIDSEFTVGDEENYGSKVDVFFGITSQEWKLAKGGKNSYWHDEAHTRIFTSNRDVKTPTKFMKYRVYQGIVNDNHRRLRVINNHKKKTLKITKGTIAAILALEFFKFKTIFLLGFDNVAQGDKRYFMSGSTGKDILTPPNLMENHCMVSEKKLLLELAEKHKAILYYFNKIRFDCKCGLNKLNGDYREEVGL